MLHEILMLCNSCMTNALLKRNKSCSCSCSCLLAQSQAGDPRCLLHNCTLVLYSAICKQVRFSLLWHLQGLVLRTLLMVCFAESAVNSVLAIGGVGGLAVGLAGREILENLFTGLIILSSSPFEVGDEVLFSPPTGSVRHLLRTWCAEPFWHIGGIPLAPSQVCIPLPLTLKQLACLLAAACPA